jgi:prolyl oligopeptidase
MDVVPTMPPSMRLPLILTLAGIFLSPGRAMPVRAAGMPPGQTAPASDDPWQWLEDVEGTRALQWVHEQSDKTLARYTADPLYKTLYPEALAVLDSQSRVPDIEQRGDHVYNLWQDKAHPRGLYRRATVASFRDGTPQWQPVLDVDALSARENKPWAFGGITCLSPAYVHCIVSLAPGGGDAVERREFNADTSSFVDGGFFVPTAKNRVDWVDQDTLYVGTDFGAGTLTESGYPRAAKIWKRGTPLAGARTIFETAATSVGARAQRIRTARGDIDLVTEQLTTWRSHVFQIVGEDLKRLDLPETARIEGGYDGALVVSLKEDWTRGGTTYANGSVILADPAALRASPGDVAVLVTPTKSEVVSAVEPMPQGIVVTMLDNVRGRLYRITPGASGVRREPIPFPDNGALRVMSTSDETGEVFAEYESFLTPPTLYYLPSGGTSPRQVTSQQPTFDGSRFAVQQLWATSADGTRIPYFVVGSKDLAADGSHPVWMFSYGGFENSLTPSYSGSYEDLRGVYGKLWLERGGVFVLPNIRGGGEFGPSWHTQALKANHVKTFEDFEAVARDLVARKITSARHIGIEGRSNGGLLVASTMIRHPELYGAIVCGSPLVDMKRYSHLLAGASWMAEYGDPDVPAEWAFLGAYSPYQNLRAGQHYPPTFVYSSTRDDRVHPGHARKLVARMEELGDDVRYFENTEGGHHASVTHEQQATRVALTYTFLWEQLK